MACLIEHDNFYKKINTKLRLLSRKSDQINPIQGLSMVLNDIKNLGYSNDINELAQWVNEILQQPRFKSVYKDVDLNWIIEQLSTSKIKQESPKQESSIGNMVDQPGPPVSDFISEVYGFSMASDAMQKQFNLAFVKAAIIDIEKGQTTKTVQEMNQNLYKYQDELYKNIVDYLKEQGDQTEFPESLFNDDGTNNFNLIRTQGDKLLSESSPKVLSDLFTSSFTSKKKRFNTINSYFILKNFDSLVKKHYGKLISIPETLFNRYNSSELKFRFNKEHDSQNTTDWFNQDIKSPGELIDSHLKLVIESLPYYQNGEYNGVNMNTDQIQYILRYAKRNFTTANAKRFRIIDELGNVLVKQSGNNPINFSEEQLIFLRNISKNGQTTLYDLVTNLRNNPSLSYDILFKILGSESFESTRELTSRLTNEGRNIITSLNKSVFNDNKSIKSLYQDLYNEFVHFFDYCSDISSTQYNLNSEGNFEIKEMIPMDTKSEEWDIRSIVNSQFIFNRLEKWKNKYNVEFHPESGEIIFYIDDLYSKEKNGQYKIIANVSGRGKSGTQFFTVYSPKGQEIKTYVEFDDISLKTGARDYSNMMGFISDVLNINPLQNRLLQNELLNNSTYNNVLQHLMNITVKSFSNAMILREKQMSRDELNVLTQEWKLPVSGDYPEIQFSQYYQGYNIIPKSVTPDVEWLAERLATIKGQLTRSVIRTAEQTNISANNLSSLMSERRNQFSVQGLSENSAVQNLIKGIQDWHLSREIKIGNKAKQHVKFNFKENIYSSFILDYLNAKDSPRFTEAVNSDKPNVPKITASWIFESGERKATGLGLILKEQGLEGVHQKIKTDLGEVYKKAWDNIKSDFNKLEQFAIEKLRLRGSVEHPFQFDIFNNFKGFHDFIEETNITRYGSNKENWKINANDLINFIIREYNLENRHDPIKFSENVHYRKSGNGIEANKAFMSMLIRLNPDLRELEYFKNQYSVDPYWVEQSDLNNYFNRNYLRMVDNCLDNDFIVSLLDQNGNNINDLWAKRIRQYKGWYDTELILAKIKVGNVWKNIKTHFDLIGITDREGRTVNDPKFDISNTDYEIEVNPLLKEWAAIDYYTTQSSVLATNGSHVWSDAKKQTNGRYEEEAAWNDFNKRNVENTATMKQFQLGNLKGISEYANIAVIDDIKTLVNAINTDSDIIKPYDGSSFTNPFQHYWENGSLAESITGVTKKPLIHFYDERTASGGLIKTATFGLTNNKLRDSIFFRRMMWKMTHHRWLNEMGQPIDADITKDFLGNEINYEDCYYEKNGKYYKLNNIKKVGYNTYDIYYQEVTRQGYENNKTNKIQVAITSNYDLWNVLGGYRSCSLDSEGNLQYSEYSMRKVAEVANKVGIIKSNSPQTQAGLYQYMKHSDIHYVITKGAIKKGAANINSSKSYTDNTDYNFFRIRMSNAGIQLDPTHNADNAEVSLMTQVISALADRGFTTDAAQDVYEALGTLARSAIGNDLDVYRQFVKTGSKQELQELVVKQIVNAFKNSSSNDGNIVQAITQNLFNILQQKGKIETSDIQDSIPWSDASVFRMLNTSIASTINKMAIKVKSFGSLSVLNPSHGIIQLYGNRKLSDFKSAFEFYNTAKQDIPVLGHDVKLGRNYRYIKDGKTEYVKMTLAKYYDFIKDYDSGLISNLSETYIGEEIEVPINKAKFGLYKLYDKNGKEYINWIDEYVPSQFIRAVQVNLMGRDLDTYNISINKGLYNIYDLDSIKTKYELHQQRERLNVLKNKSDITPEELQELTILRGIDFPARLQAIQKTIQSDLLKIKNNQDILINGKPVRVISHEVSSYGLLMPMIYQTKFGLKDGDSVSDIVNDKYFFLKRMLSEYDETSTSKRSVDSKNYDIQLKRLGNRNIYLSTHIPQHAYEVELKTYTDVNGNIWRVDSNGDELYRIASKNDRIFIDSLNINQGEIIFTEHPEFYIDNNRYYDIQVSRNSNQEQIQTILNKSDKTKNLEYKYLLFDNHNAIRDFIKTGDIDKLPKTRKIKNLIEESQRLHTSFLKSLEVLAARIPSQSMQSFMSMKVEGFVNTGVNDCYVSDMQIWLQGSDFDVDKVTLMGNAFSSTGQFITWSRFMNTQSERALRITSKLKFPTKRNVEISDGDTDLSKYSILFDENNKLNLEFSDTEEYYQKLELLVEMINRFNKSISAPESQLRSNIENVVNMHNNTYMYDETASLMNLIQSRGISISSDVTNILASQASVDNASAPLKRRADQSAFGTKGQFNRPGDPTIKAIALSDNQTGKDDIAITASLGIKTFFALTQYCNQKLKELNPKNIQDIKFRVEINGQVYNSIANIRTADMEKLKSIDYDLYESVLRGDVVDADQVISGIMTLATDNAKELKLSKLNAGQDILGLYLYGVAIGVPFETLAQIFTSSTAAVLNRRMSPHIFEQNSGKSLSRAISELENGPILNIPSQIGKQTSRVFKFLENGKFDTVSEMLHDLLMNDNTQLSFDKVISNYREFIEPLLMSSKQNEVKFAKEVREYITDMFKIGRNGLQVLNDIKTLAEGQDELATLRSLLLNQGVKVKLEDKLAFYDTFAKIFNKRFKYLDSNTSDEVKNLLKQYNNSDSTEVNFIRYITDSEYKQNIINLYGRIKKTFNVFDVIESIPHYREYLNAAGADYIRLSNSAKFRAITKVAKSVFKQYNIYEKLEKNKYYKKIDDFLSRVLIDDFLRTRPIIKLPENSYVIKDDNISISKDEHSIQLGTPEGNAMFKIWMEEQVIPDLKSGRIGKINSNNNDFIRDIQQKIYTQTSTKNNISAYSLPIDMIPKSESEKTALERYKSGFAELQNVKYRNISDYSIADLFYLYNLIVYNNKSNRTALTPVTEILYKSKNNISNLYITHVAKFDRLQELVFSDDLDDPNFSTLFTKEDLLAAVAPKSSEVFINEYNGAYLYWFNPGTLRFELLKRKEKKSNPTIDEEFENPDIMEISEEDMISEEFNPEDVRNTRQSIFEKYSSTESIGESSTEDITAISTGNLQITQQPIIINTDISDYPLTNNITISVNSDKIIGKFISDIRDVDLEMQNTGDLYQYQIIDGKLNRVLDKERVIIDFEHQIKKKLNLCD